MSADLLLMKGSRLYCLLVVLKHVKRANRSSKELLIRDEQSQKMEFETVSRGEMEESQERRLDLEAGR